MEAMQTLNPADVWDMVQKAIVWLAGIGIVIDLTPGIKILAEMGACAAPETRPGVRQAGGVTHVDSKAQYWGGSRAKGSVAVMDVLSPAKGDAASVGYLDWENLSFSWTFRRTEVLVVLEGDLNLSIEGTTFSAAHGDVFSIPAGTEVELSSSGHVRCATVAVAA